MFKFSELKSVHLEISTRCQASCPMCPRKYRGGVTNDNLKIADWTYDEFVAVFTDKVLQQLKMIYFCGNFGDPIINDDLIDMCQYVKEKAPDMEIRIHTNGSARTVSWWKNLKEALPQKHVVVFGIDGLEDTHHIYRIGTSYNTIIKNATAFMSVGGNAEWVFIKFKHNEHQVEEAERISKELGFTQFVVKNTTRFVADKKYNVVDEQGNTIYYLEPPTDNKVVFVDDNTIRNHKEILNNSVIHCYVLSTKEVYIDAHKHVFPCCFLASQPYNYQPKNPPGDEIQGFVRQFYDKTLDQYYELVESLGGIDNLSALKHPLDEIIDREEWQSVWADYWSTKKLYTCARVCGRTPQNFSKPKDQFIKRVFNG